MTPADERRWRELAEDIRAELRLISEQLKAIHEDSKANKGSNQPQPQKVIVSELSLPVAITEQYSPKEQRSKKRWRYIKFFLEFAALLAGGSLAIFTFRTLREIRRQSAAAQGQLAVMQTGQRPWLGLLGTVNKSSGPTVRFFNPTSVNYELEGTFIVHNFGTSPAFDENSEVRVDIPTVDTVTRPTGGMLRMVCPDGPTN